MWRRTDEIILYAERHRAELAAPPGNAFNLNAPVITAPVGLSNNNFFHLTCHIDSGLWAKIERGDYVNLERLLPKEKGSSFGAASTQENRLEWIQKDGQTFLAPAQDRSTKITHFRKWEQAFRVYTMIYCGANPTRSKEIWQYISVINTASTAYSWDNVANYDYTFHHLMEFNPQHSWALTYNQMWNLSMRDPIQFKGPHNSGWGGGSSRIGQNYSPKGGKPDYCWNFNKGIKCHFGKKCKFIERCSYCDSPTHGYNTCKKTGKERNKKKTERRSDWWKWWICNGIFSLEKTFWGTTSLVFLGLLIDTLRQVVCITKEKVVKAKLMTEKLMKAKKFTLHDLQKLCGFLNFLCRCVVPGRAFLTRLYSLINPN